ncbi:pre-mRNA-splicing factor 38B-like isoform X1 [Brienomyrus brachyistius]|uniref:pre-mRNA-splicing factor 38B-like isoform X1 n=3 Tax=Brienomyrus brachyistius TaxID=42636 RepID=UPI0020B18790|nr:pre-mRNA-splicing factor 38B-like isoform X1 [Brienomyrus brachyistius]
MANNLAMVGNQQQQAVNKPAAGKQGNVLPLWGNEKTMNLNPMILTNVLSSPYFKVQLYELKTYHEVVDEIYFKVTHVEPWEKGSRKTAGQTGMCGGVRGVGTGGIVSTAFCLLYKLFTLKLTRKQVMGLITHTDSPYIRALGFMYIRYTQPPSDLLDWFDGFLDDEEELDVKAGGGCVMTIGEMLRSFLTKLEWFSTLFPRIPVPVQKMIDQQIKSRPRKVLKKDGKEEMETERSPRRTPTPRRSPKRSRSKSHHRDGHGSSSFDWQLERERERQRKEREGMDKDRAERDRAAKDRWRSHSPERVSGLHGGRGRDHRRSRSASRDKKNERLEREGDGNRSQRKGRDQEKGRATERDRERSRDRRAKGEAEDRKHREEHDDKRHKDKRRAKKLSGIREGRHRSRNRGTKRSHSRSKDGTTRQRSEWPGSKRSRSRGRVDGEDRARKREQSRSKERMYQREHSNGKEQPSKGEDRRSHGVDLGNGALRSRAESS